MNKNKIAIATTVANLDLYNKTKLFFPQDIDVYAIDGAKNFFGIHSLLFCLNRLRKKDLDWLILADEDVIFTHPEKVFPLIEYLEKHNYTVAGMSEGDRMESESKHPYVINTFFAILNLSDIYKIYDEKVVLENQFIIENEFSSKKDWMPDYPYEINSLAESYYCFFLWLLRNGRKTKFLKASRPDDDYLSTIIYDHNDEAILLHTWYARYYRVDPEQTKRINKAVDLGYKNSESREVTFLRSYKHHLKFYLYKYWRKLRRHFKN